MRIRLLKGPGPIAMSEVQIQRNSHRHEAIANFLISNPGVPLSQVAAEFKVSQPWLSVIIHSDCFKSMLAEKQSEFFSLVTQDIAGKLTELAHKSIDKLAAVVEFETDTKEIREVAEAALDRIGFARSKSPVPAGASFTQNNFISADPQMLAEARARIMARTGITIEQNQLPAPTEALPTSGDSRTGEAVVISPAVYPRHSQKGETGGGDSI